MGEKEKEFRKPAERPVFPKKAVITAGMPYGNKELHFGHVGGMFVHADTFARFMRDRIGAENVIFVSGTDCYGSPILEGYRKLKESGAIPETMTIHDYVEKNHKSQKKTLDAYEISPDYFGASALYRGSEFHVESSKEIFDALYERGQLKMLSTPQFFDPEFKVLLNGRQVIGKCPIEGCCSEKAYADECDLGHQYMPSELIDPKSALSGKTPEIVEVKNWYFSLEDYTEAMQEYVSDVRANTNTRKYIMNTIEEFLKKPLIYVQKKLIAANPNTFKGEGAPDKEAFEAAYAEGLKELEAAFPEHSIVEESNKNSVTFVFGSLNDRDTAREVLGARGINYRTGKTLVPFRLSGNIEWGVPVPEKDGLKDLTFYCWPESLWAPISFTKTYLSKHPEQGNWKDWWCSADSNIYQILGEDNMYFYGPVQHAMWLCTQGEHPSLDIPQGDLQMSHLIVNKHSLFMGNKASSSGNIKPPKPDDLLKYYTVEQLRMHFLGLSIGNTSSSFMPNAFDPDAKPEDVDPVTKDGFLLSNVYNRVLRTLFYTWQSRFDGVVPVRPISEDILKSATMTILKYEKLMFDNKFHMVMYELDNYIRGINKYWVANIKSCENDDDKLAQLIADTLHMCKVAMVLLHPVTPTNIEKLKDDLKLSDDVFDWNTINEPIYNFVENKGCYKPKFIEPKYDFFARHESQFETANKQD